MTDELLFFIVLNNKNVIFLFVHLISSPVVFLMESIIVEPS